jgi:hypothetical protein
MMNSHIRDIHQIIKSGPTKKSKKERTDEPPRPPVRKKSNDVSVGVRGLHNIEIPSEIAPPMSVESYLTRELGIRFIDARKLATEARVALSSHGYLNKLQEGSVIDEAMRAFNNQPTQAKDGLRQLSKDLASCAKSSDVSSLSSDKSWDTEDTSCTNSNIESVESQSSLGFLGITLRRNCLPRAA